ncbi:hypothetical protein [Planobispora takensis]|uniref:Uncharacterized protein n=1 Tax=Planobispora takensis TaxID=1367882 RepID=A0A8J3ST38_9ACTN|nr:hypothetical protein [Planobispora takensis]GIH98230.1 hypothetical protein Pta02_02390 [Planobispora takensis]
MGYLPDRLQWSHRSQDFGDAYTTSWNYDGGTEAVDRELKKIGENLTAVD